MLLESYAGLWESTLRRIYLFLSVALLFVAVYIIKIVLRRREFVESVKWVPGPPALPIIGNALQLTGSQEEFYRILLDCGREYGPLFRLWICTRPFVFMARAADIKPILSSIHHIDKSFEYSFLQDWLGQGLITSSGGQWQRRRKMLTPAFHYDILDDFSEPVLKQVHVLQTVLDKYVNGPAFDVLPFLKLCTLDIICVTAMGKEVQAQLQANRDYVNAVERISSVVQRRFITPWLKPEVFFKHSKLGKIQDESLLVINGFVGEVIKEKIQAKASSNAEEDSGLDKSKRKAFLDLLLESADSGSGLSIQDIKDEVHTFMFAGHDTTATAMAWCLYVLGKHPDAQLRIVDEYEEVTKNGIPTYKELVQMKYLDLCIKEVMRLYPVAPLIAREITQPVHLDDGKVLPAGVTALIHSPLLHRDPAYFPNPEKFQPERFLPENSEGRHPFAYIPFSAGPRNCIGQRFAGMTTKLILANILKRFKVTSVDSEQDLNLISDIVLSNRDGINITLTPRTII